MKKWILHILLFAGLFGMLTTSCCQEVDDPTLAPENRKAQVFFTIALDSPSAASRGTWGDNLDDTTSNDYASALGTDFDNYINPHLFHVQLVVGSTTYDVDNIVYWPTSDKNVYEFIGDVEVEATSTDVKVMVFANMEKDNNGNLITTFSDDADYIPMFGVQTASLSLIPGNRTVLPEPIYLLRAMAKVEVELTADGYTLESLKLNRYNTQGNCLPQNWNEVENTKALTHDGLNCFNPNATATAELPFTVENKHLIFYLPEVSNTKDNELAMEVSLKKGDKPINLKTPYLYFRNYNAAGSAEGTPYNVVRNHWYKYSITAVKDNGQLNLELTVKPWNLEQKELHYKTEGGAKQPITWNNVGAQPNSQNEVLLGGNNPSSATFSFELSTPTGATWYASLVPVRGDENAFSFSNDSQVTTTVSGAVGQASGDITIYATKTSDIQTNNEARLEIIVVTDDRTINVTDLLGGEYKIMQAKSE